MRVVRLMLACLLGLGVAVQGYASLRVMDASCPMTHHGANHLPDTQGAHSAHEHPDAVLTHDGHHGDHGPAAEEVTPCACIAGCHLVNSAPLEFALLPAPMMVSRHASLPVEYAFRSHTVFRLWRPPAQI
jgi:hypothetical protein